MLNPSIDLTNACNLNCSYCYIEERNSGRKLRRPNEITLDESLRVIDDMYECGAKTINIVGAGEPTIDPHFDEIVSYINAKGLWTVLFTNGITMANDPALVRRLYSMRVSVILKFNSLSKETQDLVAGRDGYSERRDKALQLFIDAGFCSYVPTRLGVDIIVFKGNLDEIPSIQEWCRVQNIFPIAGEFIPTGRTEAGQFHGFAALAQMETSQRDKAAKLLQPLAPDERVELVGKLADVDRKYGIERPGCFAYFGGGICSQILGLYVDIEGNIWPCVARKKIEGAQFTNGLLGNTRRGDLPSKVWKEDPYINTIRIGFDGGCPYKAFLGSRADIRIRS